MTSTTTPVSKGIQAKVNVLGAGNNPNMVLVSITGMSNYATGGVALTMPTDIKGQQLVCLDLITRHDGTRIWEWDGSTSAPKLKAYDAFATEEGAATVVSSVTLYAWLIYGG